MSTDLKELYRYRGEPKPGVGYGLARIFFIIAFIFVLTFFLGSLTALVVYAAVARDLPSAGELTRRASTFNSTHIYDRNGKLLFELNDPNAGRRIVVPIQQIPPNVIEATLATEDPTFYTNPGFDIVGIARALFNVTIRGREVGGSTITQQLVKNVYQRGERSVQRKVSEIILAQELTRQYPKDQILEIYLNEIYYGNLAYGIEAAAETYFGKHAVDLNLAEASFLAGLPQAPALYDPYTNFEDAKARQRIVLNLMVQHAVVVNQRGERAKLSAEDATNFFYDQAPQTKEDLRPLLAVNENKSPYFVNYILQLLQDRYGAQDIYKLGLNVETTFDLDWQRVAERVAKTQVEKIKNLNVSNAALVAMDSSTGGIIAMVGGIDFETSQVNVSLRPRQPGSSIKPVTYIAAFEKGWTPATLMLDNPSKFPNAPNPDYEPRNYDGKFHGLVTVRDALGNSYNVPAVKALNFVGIQAMIKMAERLGIKSFTRKDYGLSLTLGGGEVTLLDLTTAYAVFSNQGKRVTPLPIAKITDGSGKLIEEYKPAPAQELVKPQLAYLITDILKDNAARTPAFGPNSLLKLSRPAAVKTGTTNDSRDNWTVGYTAEGLVVGVWVGNNNNSPMKGTSGVSGAAPIWHDFIEEVLKGPAKDFAPPPELVPQTICSDTGFVANELCAKKRPEIFLKTNVPPIDNVHRKTIADKLTGQPYDERCPLNLREERTVVAYVDEEFRQWAASSWQFRPGFTAADFYKGDELRDWAMTHDIAQLPKPLTLSLTSPTMNESVQGMVNLIGSVDIPDFAQYTTEFGVGDDPIGWGQLSAPSSNLVRNSVLSQWDSSKEPNGIYSLRVVANDKKGNKAEACTRVVVANAGTPTPTETPVPSMTPTPFGTPTPKSTPTSTSTPFLSATPTPFSTATPTAFFTATPFFSPTPIITLPPILPTKTPTNTPKPASTPTPTRTPTPNCATTPVGLLTPTPTPVCTATPTKTPKP